MHEDVYDLRLMYSAAVGVSTIDDNNNAKDRLETSDPSGNRGWSY